MITATYFGEITELGSRAVWYSDEEDSDDDIDDKSTQRQVIKSIRPNDHKILRSSIQVNLRKTAGNSELDFHDCVISLSTSFKFKNLKFDDKSTVLTIGSFGTVGKAFALPTERMRENQEPNSYTLWLVFDASNQYVSGQEVNYFVESIREEIKTHFNSVGNSDKPIIVLSQQFSGTDRLEYLSNCEIPPTKLPFKGERMLPPSLIRNQFESALFEQLTLALKPTIIACLPDPRNYWFDRTQDWLSISNYVIEHRLNDDSLEKTLIFT